jgi:hypothetical protein
MSNLNKPPRDERQLEQYIERVLGRQPLRQAPSSLEARVLREIAVRAARPWWLQGFSQWPSAARALFLPLGLGLIQLSFVTTGRLMSLWQTLQTSSPASSAQSGLQALSNLSQTLQTLGHLVTRGISPVWIYGGIGLALFLYAALFGLGAAAFRTLIVPSEPVRYST